MKLKSKITMIRCQFIDKKVQAYVDIHEIPQPRIDPTENVGFSLYTR